VKDKIAIWKAKLKWVYTLTASAWRDRAIIRSEWEMLKIAFPIAVTAVNELQDTKFFGATRTQIAFQKVQYELKLRKVPQDDLTGAMVFVAVSLAYLHTIKGICAIQPTTGGEK
jgi:hypothetical protein